MKKLLYLILSVSFISCDSINKTDSVKKSLEHKKFLSKFKDISFDTLKVSSPENSNSEFIGIELDSLEATLFPEDMAHQHFVDGPVLFGVYKFPVDSKTLGLIARTPSEYSASSVKLFFYDIIHNKVNSYFELAENIGDAGTLMVKKSYLFKEKNKSLRVLIDIGDYYDHAAEDEKNTIVDENHSYYLISVSGQRIDTLSRDAKSLKREFKYFIK